MCYMLAITQEFYNAQYAYLEETKALWTAGNLFLPMGILHFAYRLAFKYKIVIK